MTTPRSSSYYDTGAGLPAALARMQQDLTNCTLCWSGVDVVVPCARSCPPTGSSTRRPKLMIVGQNPPSEIARRLQGAWMIHYGHKYDHQRGPHEWLMLDLIKLCGLVPAQVWATQIVKCPTPDNKRPTPWQATSCARNFLSHEIRLLRPEVILFMGVAASANIESVLASEYRLARGKQSSRHYPIKCRGTDREATVAVTTWGPVIQIGELPHRDGHDLRRHGEVSPAPIPGGELGVLAAPHPSYAKRFLDTTQWLSMVATAYRDAAAWRAE